MSKAVRCHAGRLDSHGYERGRLRSRDPIRFPRSVSPSLAAWRTSTRATQFGILGAAFGALSMRKYVS